MTFAHDMVVAAPAMRRDASLSSVDRAQLYVLRRPVRSLGDKEQLVPATIQADNPAPELISTMQLEGRDICRVLPGSERIEGRQVVDKSAAMMT